MSLKKFNAVCSWILTVLLIAHIVISVVFMTTGLFNLTLMVAATRAIEVVCIAHIVVSLTIVFILNDKADKSQYKGQKAKLYPALNLRTMIQRVSGLIILVMIHPHIATFSSFVFDFKPISVTSKILVFIIEALFFGVVLLHLAVSFSRSFISMGMIRTEETEKKLDRATFIFCGATFVITLISLAVFLVKWPTA